MTPSISSSNSSFGSISTALSQTADAAARGGTLRVVRAQYGDEADVELRAVTNDALTGAREVQPLENADTALKTVFPAFGRSSKKYRFKAQDMVLGLHRDASPDERPVLIREVPVAETVRAAYRLDADAEFGMLRFSVLKPSVSLVDRWRARFGMRTQRCAEDRSMPTEAVQRCLRGVYLPSAGEFRVIENDAALTWRMTEAVCLQSVRPLGREIGRSVFHVDRASRLEVGTTEEGEPRATLRSRVRAAALADALDVLRGLRRIADAARIDPAGVMGRLTAADEHGWPIGVRAARLMCADPTHGETALRAYFDVLNTLYREGCLTHAQILLLLLPERSGARLSVSTAVALRWEREAVSSAFVRLLVAATPDFTLKSAALAALQRKEAQRGERRGMDFFKRLKYRIRDRNASVPGAALFRLYAHGLVPRYRGLWQIAQTAWPDATDTEIVGAPSLARLPDHLDAQIMHAAVRERGELSGAVPQERARRSI